MTFDDYIARCGIYRRSYGQQDPTADDDFIAALNADPALLAHARAEKARCTPEVIRRCFGSRVTNDILTDVLERAK